MTAVADPQLQGVMSALTLVRNVLDRRQESVAAAFVTMAMDDLERPVSATSVPMPRGRDEPGQANEQGV